MNKHDYIRAGVDIAEGFHFDGLTGFRWITNASGSAFRFPGQWALVPEFHKDIFLDVLAAQLIRQFDKKDGFEIAVLPKSTTIRILRGSDKWLISKGPCRAMNTIKVIVESKLLDAGDFNGQNRA